MDVDLKDDGSDTDSSSVSNSKLRLGVCEVCNDQPAKYTCPKCEVKTCALKCLQIHKKELTCDGVRNKTKYIPIQKMSTMDFQSDYNFLEECSRFVEARKSSNLKKFTCFNKTLPTQLFRLRNAAKEREITLKFLLQNFTKRKINSTFFDTTNKVIYWRVEWIFPHCENSKFIDEKLNENTKLNKLLDKYLNPEYHEDFAGKNLLAYYHSRGLSGVKILLKSEGIKKCQNRYYELDPKKSLNENLKQKIIVEYPIIYIIYNDIQSDLFDIIDSDDDLVNETREYENSLNEFYEKQKISKNIDQIHTQEKEIHKNMEKLKIAKKRDERRKKREANENEPQNYLFSDERMWHDFSDSDGNITEEEEGSKVEEVFSPKRIKIEN